MIQSCFTKFLFLGNAIMEKSAGSFHFVTCMKVNFVKFPPEKKEKYCGHCGIFYEMQLGENISLSHWSIPPLRGHLLIGI
jgi:hypothetical protein